MKPILVIVRRFTFAVCTFGLGLSPLARDYYLNPAAAGGNDGLTPSSAWIAPDAIKASVFADNDELIILNGDAEKSLILIGLSNMVVRVGDGVIAPPTFRDIHVYNCNNLEISGNGGVKLAAIGESPSVGHAVNVRLCKNVLLKSFLIDRHTRLPHDVKQQHGIRVWDNSTGIRIVDSTIQNTSGDGINVTQTVPTPEVLIARNNIIIEKCIIRNTGDDGIQLAASGVSITDSIINKESFPAYFGGHPDGIQVERGFSDFLFARNKIRNWDQGIFVEYGGGNISIVNNIFESSNKYGNDKGIVPAGADGFRGLFVIANNTFYNFVNNCAVNGLMTLPNSSASVFKNNVFVNCRFISGRPDFQTLISSDNLYYDEADVVFYMPDGTTSGIPSNRLLGGATSVSEFLRSPRAMDYRIIEGASVIGTAVPMNHIFETDYYKTVRGNQWDPGAIEFDGENDKGSPPPKPSLTITNTN